MGSSLGAVYRRMVLHESLREVLAFATKTSYHEFGADRSVKGAEIVGQALRAWNDKPHYR